MLLSSGQGAVGSYPIVWNGTFIYSYLLSTCYALGAGVTMTKKKDMDHLDDKYTTLSLGFSIGLAYFLLAKGNFVSILKCPQIQLISL